LTNLERKKLLQAYSDYVSGRFNELVGFVVLVVGFCLGTLSSTKIEPKYNLTLVVIVLITFLILMLKEKNSSDSNLRKELDLLEKSTATKQIMATSWRK